MALLSASTTIETLGDVLAFIAPHAGGAVPQEGTQVHTDWVTWTQNKYEEYAKRAFWRRCLTREVITLTVGETTVLPVRFNRPNGIYMLIVDDVDWNDPENSDEQSIFVEMDNDPDSADFAKWRVRFLNEIETETEAILWYFANPPIPQASSDKLLLPGDMIGFAVLSEYFRQTFQAGSQDDAFQAAENRFSEYLTLEVLPDKGSLLTHKQQTKRRDFLKEARLMYTNRRNRNYQS